jgi:hypothetical protein
MVTSVTTVAMAKKQATTIYITEQQQLLLKELNKRSKVPVAEYIREGIDMVLHKYRDHLPGQMELGLLPQGTLASASDSNSDGASTI